MFDLFGIGNMGNYEERKVARWPEEGDWVVDTCRVTDSDKPFETAVKHSSYNDGEMVIVEEYEDNESAQKGHDKWVKIMSANELPERLVDVSTCIASKFCGALTGDGFRQNPKMQRHAPVAELEQLRILNSCNTWVRVPPGVF